MKIAVAGTGYVGLSIATLLAQHNEVTAVDIVPEKVAMINRHQSPIQDEYIEKYLAEKPLHLTALHLLVVPKREGIVIAIREEDRLRLAGLEVVCSEVTAGISIRTIVVIPVLLRHESWNT